MRRILTRAASLIVLVALLATGCITGKNPENWLPQDGAVHGKYYSCLRDAQQGYAMSSAGVAVGPYGGGGSAVSQGGMKTSHELLQSCMRAQGYAKRKATTGEIVAQIIFFPIYFPLCVLANDCTGY